MESKDIYLISEEKKISQNVLNNIILDQNKKCIIISLVIYFIIILSVILIYILTTKELKSFKEYFNYKLIKSDLGYQNILVNWTFNEYFDISINVKGVENEIIRTYNIYNTTQGEQLIKVYYGIPKIYIEIKKNDNVYKVNEEFNIPTKEILIGAFYATLPPLIFTLDVFNITKKFNCPIYVDLERYNAWNWNNLPQRILMFDFLDLNNFNIDFDTILDKMKIWIGQIYQVNNKTIFHVYMTDVHNYILPLCFYTNNIPNENYNIYLITDGSWSYVSFNSLFDNNETYFDTYNQLKIKYEEFKEYIWHQKSYDRDSTAKKNIKRWDLFSYIYIILKEEKNIHWWLTKIKGLFAPNNPVLLEELLNNKNISLKNLNTLFKSLNNDEKKQIKSLLNFDSNYFEEAYKLNKSIMLIVGSSVENNLYDHCLAAELFYKDDYIYYYKAHPATPVENDPEKIERLKKMNITPIDSNIPLEVILYFIPDVICSGYYSSTFIEIEKERLGGVFIKNEKDDEILHRFDYVSQYIKKDNKKYGKYLNDNNDGILLEINKNKLINFPYDFGIFLKNNKSISYFNDNQSIINY